MYVHDIDPIALQLGPLKVHWYGLMYLVGFAGGWALMSYRAKRSNGLWQVEQVSDLLFYIALGVILGGRIGSMLFYHFDAWLENPLQVFKVWDGGMSFHGGLLGVLIAMYFYGKKINKSFFQMTDFIAPMVPLGLAAGRVGNFINGELYGRVTDVSWAMIFPQGGSLPRHPSMLYECALEGVLLFLALWWYSSKPRPRMAVSGLFLLGYGLARFTVEFFREPDSHLGFIAFDWLTMGQLLTVPMIILGIAFIVYAYHCRALVDGMNSDDRSYMQHHASVASEQVK
ncbi:prolipoprotein diacylglyceryl transferase [Zooshikella harenae]|uniref:Phosphatidylglycerol--prolipoprotein diacylglyceryl transferase n=1 Tax=Zooshikella harenae TaxID=2827238 RepID=A0ABS5Z9A8_9GAMM|nr:prolipoprotein diacylglyceryl transferase [Zooshikella harenae]MBU2710634.1 prolipoprotein diacylglyceryl transferase [Zooshikella harenae]